MASPSLLLTIHGALVFAASKTTTSKTNPDFLIFLVFLFALYFLWIRPQRRKLRSTQLQRNAPEVGDDVVTAAGIIGRVLNFEGDRAEIEVAPGQTLTVLRSALGRRLDPIVPESADDDTYLADHDHDHGSDHDHEHDHDDDHDHDHDGFQPEGYNQDADEADETPPQQEQQHRWWPGSSKDDDTPEGSN
jgi:preprotein translocase YajC subunit